VVGGETEAATRAASSGDQFMQQKRYAQALTAYKEGLAASPQSTSLLYNGGLAAYLEKDYTSALKLWSALKSLQPGDHQVRSKLIQTYQAAGEFVARDKERAAMLLLHPMSQDAEFKKKDSYCLEQFEVAGASVRAYEFFELKGEFAVRYLFSILNDDGATEKYRLTLGSYDITNAIARENGNLKPGERRFHLDGYYDAGKTHKTYGLFRNEPTYDEARAMVINVISGKHMALEDLKK